MSSHEQKSYVALCFNCLDLMNAMLLLTMLLESCYADAIASSVKLLNVSY